ncbi:PREDICTED: transient receptor potential cation channel subfamily A member 1-like [Amphimedon queenslandica]|uniref:Ion transport domain-containing protein n=1 Tax=Amphimedon queenslandica TaxID=400682 RepID=A0AAN0JWQ9_AMPQE|nr:PREDICTED: transient receptor potential cation channel subfamily A member 1-like [Amphimedon queenslandica]|eukprot:XP_019861513.1 PREDICTED: transient receptor potential cation channel subfamily A member 1-like [Amphimedon queenslandica]
MTMGELDIDSLLRQDNELNAPDIQYPVVSFLLLIVFVILMPILFLNLLTSLAVGDTEEIRKSADACRRTLRVEFTLPVEVFLRSIRRRLPTVMKLWIESLVTVQQEQKVTPNEGKEGITRAISKIQEYFATEPEENVDEVKYKSNPLSEEVKDLHSSVSEVKDLCSSVSQEMKDLHSSVSEEVKDLRSSVSKEVKDLRSSMDQLLAIVKSMNERRGGEVRGLEEQ